MRPVILKPDDYLAISEGRAESSLAVERQVSRSRACSLARSEERRQDRWAARSAPLPLTSVTQVDSSEDRDKMSGKKNKEAVREKARNESKDGKETGKDGKETGKDGKKKRRKGRKKGRNQATPSVTASARTELDGVSVDGSHFETDDVGVEASHFETKPPSIDKVSNFSSPEQPRSLREETLEKPETPTSVSETPTSVSETPTSVSGTIRSSSLEKQSVPASEGFEVSNNPTSDSEKDLPSPIEVQIEVDDPVHELIHTTHPSQGNTDEGNTDELVKTSPVEHV